MYFTKKRVNTLSNLMENIPFCLWNIQRQTVYCPPNTTAFLSLDTATCFRRYDYHRVSNTIFQSKLKCRASVFIPHGVTRGDPTKLQLLLKRNILQN
jgi:hypothetical protein